MRVRTTVRGAAACAWDTRTHEPPRSPRWARPRLQYLPQVALAKVRETSRNNVSMKHHLKSGEELFQKP